MWEFRHPHEVRSCWGNRMYQTEGLVFIQTCLCEHSVHAIVAIWQLIMWISIEGLLAHLCVFWSVSRDRVSGQLSWLSCSGCLAVTALLNPNRVMVYSLEFWRVMEVLVLSRCGRAAFLHSSLTTLTLTTGCCYSLLESEWHQTGGWCVVPAFTTLFDTIQWILT